MGGAGSMAQTWVNEPGIVPGKDIFGENIQGLEKTHKGLINAIN